jgi:hypothetical protein
MTSAPQATSRSGGAEALIVGSELSRVPSITSERRRLPPTGSAVLSPAIQALGFRPSPR